MRGAVAARKALAFGASSSYMPEHNPAAARGEGNGDGDPIFVDRGSCSRSVTTCPNCNGSKDHAREEITAAVGTDSRWEDHGGESAGDAGQGRSRADTTSSAGVAVAAEKPLFSTSEKRPVVKEEETTIQSEDPGAHESTLAKLKRKIRLKLLAEEARNSQLLAEAQENIRNARQDKRATEDDGPSSSLRVKTENRNPSHPLHQQDDQLHQQQLSHARQQPLNNNGSKVRVQGRIIVDLSSDDEAGVSDPSRIRQQHQHQHQQNKHLSQRVPQASGIVAAAATIRPKEEEAEDYGSILESMLRPLLARAAAAAVDQTTSRPAQEITKRSTAGGHRSSKPISKVKSELVDELADLLDLGKGRNSMPVGAASARGKRGGTQLDRMVDKPTAKKRGRPKGVSLQKSKTTTTVKTSRPTKEKGKSEVSQIAAVPSSYEQERDNNLIRNRAFLQGLGFCPKLPQPPTPLLENRDPDWAEKDHDVIRNNDFQNDHRVESQRSQITSALSGSSSAIQRSGKAPTTDDDYDEAEDLEENDHNSSKSSKLARMRGKVKPSSKGKEKAPRGRPRKAKPTATTPKGTSSPNQELIRILAELLSSKNASSIPPNLLQRLDNSTNGGESDHTGSTTRRGRPPGSKKKPTEVRHLKEKRKAESSPPPRKSGSPTTTTRSAGTEGKKRKETWLTTIPFETPKTEYEMQRDEAIQDRKDHIDKLGAVAELFRELNAPRQTRPYHKRWTSLNPEYNRQTRLRDRLSAKSDTKSAVKSEALELEIIEAGEVDTLEVRPDSSFAYSLVAKFSNWGTLQKHRPAAPSREWDLNEPLMSMGARVMSFQAQEGREQLLDPLLTRIYTMDVGAIRGEYNGLLAAGGSQGRIAVFALKGAEGWSRYGRARLNAFSAEDEARVPILAWSIDSSWVSQVIFLPSQFKEKEMLLLSSSNDGRVVLWDVNHVRMKKGNRELTQEGMPRVVCQTTTLHSGSIFGMHEMDSRMATASEDGVGISAIRETMIFMERCITGHHSGVIRSVRFRDKNVLADCGADMEMGILDLRCPEPCTLKISTAYQTAISMVEWSPGSDNVLLSASLDPQIYLHDIRSPRECMHKLDSHVHPSRLKCYSVYRPAFIDGGQAIVSPGEGTHQLSLYAVDTGSAIGKVDLEFDTTIVHWSALVPTAEGGLWAGSNAITYCRPVWRLPGSVSQFDDDDHKLQPSSQCSEGCASAAGDAPTPRFQEPL